MSARWKRKNRDDIIATKRNQRKRARRQAKQDIEDALAEDELDQCELGDDL